MFQETGKRTNGISKEYHISETDEPNYQMPDFAHTRPFDKVTPIYRPNNMSRSKANQVYRMTKQGGDPIKVIMAVSGADAQLCLLSYQKHKALGIDRPTVRYKAKITQELNNEIISRYAAKESVKSISKDLKVGIRTIYQHATKVISRKPPVRTQVMKAEALKMYDDGNTCSQIARHFKVHPQVIRRIILIAHPEMKALTERKFVRLTPNDKKIVIQMFQEGKLIGHIAKLTGHSKTTVERLVGHVPSRSYTRHSLNQLHDCYISGLSLKGTCRKLNLPITSTSSVKYHFDKFKKGLYPSI